ncbi:MAG: hypothetical protein N2169_07665 [bacterium]|nr:hypothetical protein [bacterium]
MDENINIDIFMSKCGVVGVEGYRYVADILIPVGLYRNCDVGVILSEAVELAEKYLSVLKCDIGKDYMRVIATILLMLVRDDLYESLMFRLDKAVNKTLNRRLDYGTGEN